MSPLIKFFAGLILGMAVLLISFQQVVADYCARWIVLDTLYCEEVDDPTTGELFDCKKVYETQPVRHECDLSSCITKKGVCSLDDYDKVSCVLRTHMSGFKECVLTNTSSCSWASCWVKEGGDGCADSLYPKCSSGTCPVCTACKKDGANGCKCVRTCVICNQFPPDSLAVSRNPDDSFTATWNVGIRGTHQRIYVGYDPEEVESGCPGGVGSGLGCIVSEELTSNIDSYTVPADLFESGYVYFWLVANFKTDACVRYSNLATSISSCQLSPPSLSLGVDQTTAATMQVYETSIIDRVDFSSPGGFVSLDPASDSEFNDGFSTQVTGVSPGATTLTGDLYLSASAAVSCTDTINVSVGNSGPWFQAVGGNVHANGGNVSSQIPSSCSGVCSPYLILEDAGGATGLVSYSGSADVGEGEISEDGNNWQAQTSYQGLQTGYSYFSRILEDDPLGINSWDGSLPGATGVYRGEGVGGTSGGDWDIADGTVIVLLVPNDVTINNSINVAEGGFLAIISSGNITVADDVDQIEGVFIADGIIDTGSADLQLNGEGIFVGWEGFNLGRDLADNALTPAELFTYRPDLVSNAYEYLLKPQIGWKEVAP